LVVSAPPTAPFFTSQSFTVSARRFDSLTL